jgi:flagellar basal body-associated protein FliL
MAEENKPEGAQEEEGKKPKLRLTMLQLGLILQTLCLLGAGAVITKVALFTKHHDLRESTLRERAIASIQDSADEIQNVSLSDFTVNLPQDHLLKTKLELEVSNPRTAALLDKRMSAVRARVLNVLSEQPLESANTLQGKLRLKDAIREAINEELLASGEKRGVVREVYFMDLTLI